MKRELNQPYNQHDIIHWQPEGHKTISMSLVNESPLSISIQDRPFYIAERTAGDELVQVAGFCLYSGIVMSTDEIVSLDFVKGAAGDHVNVTLTPNRWETVRSRVENGGCNLNLPLGGGAGDLLEWVCRQVLPQARQFQVKIRKGLTYLDQLIQIQPLRQITGATHAAAIYNRFFDQLAVAEDVGRHNAVDKTIGRLFLSGKLKEADVMLLSSRISFELVHKAARAGIPVIFAVSLPTALAVQLAIRLDMTLVCVSSQGGGFVFCGVRRLNLQ